MKIDKHYSDFGGLDTRSNKLLQRPNTARRGSKNFRFNFQDELQQSNGFQRKSETTGQVNLGDIEYKYKDLDTGESKTEILCVCADGNLYRKKAHYLFFVSIGANTSYSFYYDEVANDFKFTFSPSGTLSLSITATMDDLKTGLNALGVGVNVVILDETGTSITSTKLAHYMDCVIDFALFEGQQDKMSSWFFEKVDYPSIDQGITEVPFITSMGFYTDKSYEGISYVNLNNVCYITDGGFLLKYDGKQVYRAGCPKILAPYFNGNQNVSGFALTGAASGAGEMDAGVTYKYLFRLGCVDAQGSKIYGTFDTGLQTEYMYKELIATQDTNVITYNQVDGNYNFPFYACKVSGGQNIASAGGTINVDSGHNIKVGMCLRIPVSNNLAGYSGYSYIYSKVSAVTATTITLEKGMTSGSAPFPYNRVVQYTGTRTSGSPTITGLNFILNGNISTGDNVISGLSSTANIRVGDGAQGSTRLAATTVTEIISSTSVRVAGTGISTGADVFAFYFANRATAGDTITGTGIAASTTVVSFNLYAGTLLMSANATASGATELTFSQYPTLVFDDQILNGGFTQEIYENTIDGPNTNYPYLPDLKVGAFLEVYRTTADTDTFYKLIDLPILNNRTDLTFNDYFSDDDLSRILFEDVDQGGELPRACKYLGVWQNQLIQAGRPVNGLIANDLYPTATGFSILNLWGEQEIDYLNYLYTEVHLCDFQSIYWNDVLTAEGFPQSGLFENIVESTFNDRTKGLGVNKDALFVFKDKTTAVITGTLATQDIVQEILEDTAGCVNHRTIQDVEGALVWLDEREGFYSCVAGRLPVKIGYPIIDEFKINPNDLDLNKSIAQTFKSLNLYVCIVDSKIFLYDYANTGNQSIRGCWYMWDAQAGISLLETANDELLLNDGSRLMKLKVTNTKYDFTNHTSAIPFVYLTAWQNYGSPTIDKDFRQIWFNSVQGDFNITVTEYGNYLDTSIGEYSVDMPLEAVKKTVKEFVKCTYPKLSSLSVGFSNSEKNKYVRIQGFEIQLDESYDKSEPKK